MGSTHTYININFNLSIVSSNYLFLWKSTFMQFRQYRIPKKDQICKHMDFIGSTQLCILVYHRVKYFTSTSSLKMIFLAYIRMHSNESLPNMFTTELFTNFNFHCQKTSWCFLNWLSCMNIKLGEQLLLL